MKRPPSSSPDPRVLLVEGEDDKHVVLQLCDHHESFSVDWPSKTAVLSSPSASSFSVEEKGGICGLLSAIEPAIKVSGRQAVGILADANDDVDKRWNAITCRLPKVGTRLPASPNPAGTIIDGTDGTPRVGIWLMPNNESCGELEDFVVQMIRGADRVWPLSQGYIKKIPQADRKFSEKKEKKAQLYAWLAARKDPGRMGSAIGAGDLEIGGKLSKKFVDWLRQLFG